jgi:hypothetical protein
LELDVVEEDESECDSGELGIVDFDGVGGEEESGKAELTDAIRPLRC